MGGSCNIAIRSSSVKFATNGGFAWCSQGDSFGVVATAVFVLLQTKHSSHVVVVATVAA
jgi:hypothetical protein